MTLVLACFISMAAEFWLEPKKFKYGAGEEIKIDFREGESFTGEFWDMTGNKVEMLQWYSTAGVRDLSKMVKPTRGNNVTLKLSTDGTQLFTLRSAPVARAWDAEKFNAYLEEEGLDEIADTRRRSNRTGDPATESYARLAKVLVQVGERIDDTFKKRTGMRLDIMLSKNPYLVKSGDYLECLILYEGKPLPHALVKVWNRLNQTTFLQNIYTENDGTLKFPVSTTGAWMVSTVKMIPSEKPGVEWDSLCGSLVFGIQ